MSHVPGRLRSLMGDWNPWRELRRRPHIRFGLARLPAACGGGVYGRDGDRVSIILDRQLSQAERRCVITHELIHDERGTHCHAMQADAWDIVVTREELRVHDEAVGRLVPPPRLVAFCRGISDFLAVEPHQVADEFHVTVEYAERALFLLAVDEHRRAQRSIA